MPGVARWLTAIALAAAACGGEDRAVTEVASAATAPTTSVPETASTTDAPTTLVSTVPTSTAVPTTTTPPTSTIPATSTTTTTTSTTSTATIRPTSTTVSTSTTTVPPTTTTTTTATTTPAPVQIPSPPSVGALTTACSSIALIGDSTFIGIEQLLADQLAIVGVTEARLEIDGGRSVVERLGEQENGAEVAGRLVSAGFQGCWVIGLGTNDAANIAAGSNVDAAGRVQRMLDATGSGPILWIDASTITTETFWQRPNVLLWNDALRAAGAGSDRIRVAPWDTLASGQPWFVSDGIHPNSVGLAERARFLAESLAIAFPG